MGIINYENRTYGYARVSSKDQNAQRQIEALTAAGVDARFIFVDKQSGKDFDRPQYLVLMNALRRGDVLVVPSIDRLGRNYTEIQNEWRRITKEVQADIKVLDMPLLDTTAHKNSLTDVFVADLVLQILAYVAEQERSHIRARQAEGIAAAKAKGKNLGRPCAEFPDNWKDVYNQWKAGRISGVKAMKMSGLKKNTFYKLVKRYENG
jgi:DNA invertase Pin-like site-specific DNA recombinase